MPKQEPTTSLILARYDRVTATFSPRKEVTPYVRAAIGRRGRFRVAWRIDPGAPIGAGEWAMIPLETWDAFPFLWRPISDLVDIEVIPRRSAIERRRGGRPKKELAAANATE
jgi:hypothetical protein